MLLLLTESLRIVKLGLQLSCKFEGVFFVVVALQERPGSDVGDLPLRVISLLLQVLQIFRQLLCHLCLMPDLQILSLQLVDFSLKVLHLLLLVFDVFLLLLEHSIICNSITPHLLDLLRNLDQLLLLNLQVPLKLVCAVGWQLPLEPISLGGQSVDLGG